MLICFPSLVLSQPTGRVGCTAPTHATLEGECKALQEHLQQAENILKQQRQLTDSLKQTKEQEVAIPPPRAQAKNVCDVHFPAR